MEPKKTPKANVERFNMTFFLIGAIVSLGVVISAFKYKQYEKQQKVLTSDLEVDVEEEMTEITKQQEKPPPPPPPPEIKIVEDKVEVEEDQPEVQEQDVTQETVVEDIPQMKEEKVEEDKVFVAVEDQPEFPGGQQALYKWISNHIKYPQREKEVGIQGRVIVQFVVEKDGSVTNVKAVKGPSEGLKKEAIRVVKNMPDWRPGKQRGKPVRVRYTIPIFFRLN
jgi:protein TonB